jgi:hypothetical protein
MSRAAVVRAIVVAVGLVALAYYVGLWIVRARGLR